jgi:outer membrane protein OmpA-like peptidoglycan-associated protein
MNTRTLALVAFFIWSAICWRWYVCRIKLACENDASALSEQVDIKPVTPSTEPVTTPEIQPVETGNNVVTPSGNTVQKTGTDKSSYPPTAAESTKPISPNKIDEVQMERVADRMVIHFPYNSLRREDDRAIDAYLTQLANQVIASGQVIRITGHTDFVGETKDNASFGLQRANSIKSTLLKKGVPKGQVKTYSKGESKPVATNDTPLGRYKNRRVEIVLSK